MPRHETTRKALVLGHDTRAFLSVIRSLGRAGIEVHVAWFDETSPAMRSRYVAKAHGIPRYRDGDTGWKDAFAALMQTERFDLVIPCDDQRALPLGAHRAELERFGRIALPHPEALDVLGDKLKTAALARSLGIPVPREGIVHGREELSTLRGDFSPPLIVKPPSSYTLRDIDTRQSVRRADTWEAAERLLDETLDDGPVAIQGLFTGVGMGVELLVHEGVPCLAFQHVRLHEPLEGGGSSYRQGVPLSPELYDAAVKLLAAVRHTGVAMVEFKRERKSGRWVLLEVNARFWGSLPLAIASGADFPLALFQLLVDGRTDVPGAHRLGLRSRNLRGDARWLLTNARADRSDPTINSRPWPGVVRETAESLLSGRERSDTFTRDDPAPGVAEAVQLLREAGERGRRLASSAHARVNPRRRRRLEAAARSDIARASRVLFVCKGNIARSPFAAAVAHRLLDGDRHIASAGFLHAGRRSAPEAVAAAGAWEVDLTGHRSRQVSAELVRESDAIFVFDHGNYRGMLESFPEARDRVHLFGALDARGPLAVPDPWGRGRDVHTAIYRRIADTLAAALTR